MPATGTATWSPWVGERLSQAWLAALGLLAEGEWRGAPALMTVMTEAADIQPKTVENLLREGAKWGALQDKRDGSRRFERRMFRINPLGPLSLLQPPEEAPR